MTKVKKDPRGRKPVKDKKKPVQVYIPESRIKELGGLPNARQIALTALEKQ